jgi:heparanase 1
MIVRSTRMLRTAAAATFLLHAICCIAQAKPGLTRLEPRSLDPKTMARLGTVDERFQSYNVEMLEITGGDFWRPYRPGAPGIQAPSARARTSVPQGMDPRAYQYRAPLDLSNPRLRRLAAALGPAYIRVSGTWANTTYFNDGSEPPLKTPPAGFGGVLTGAQWKGVIEFARAADAELVTSFAISAGTRDAAGLWTPAQAGRLIAYTHGAGGSIAAAEFMNEPTAAAMGGAPQGYDAAAYARDLAVFKPFLKQASPDTILLGPGGVGEGGSMPMPAMLRSPLSSESILQATGPAFDALSYHYYGGVSSRCAAMAPAAVTSETAARGSEWLARTAVVEAYYAGLRDQYLPGKPLWLTETADAACGGSRWASKFVDTFRYLNQLGILAQRGVQVVMHNTLDASDYGLLDETDYAPRPKYWAALLWRRMMGTAVLQPQASPAPELHLYAHCLRGVRGGVAVLAINAGDADVPLLLPQASTRFVLSSPALESIDTLLNGRRLELGAHDALPTLKGASAASGPIVFAPQTITFIAIPTAANPACTQ